MKRGLIFLAVSVVALVAARGVLAAPQSHGSATLSGVVIGPDDKPAPHASVSYQSSDGSAPHAVHAEVDQLLRERVVVRGHRARVAERSEVLGREE